MHFVSPLPVFAVNVKTAAAAFRCCKTNDVGVCGMPQGVSFAVIWQIMDELLSVINK